MADEKKEQATEVEFLRFFYDKIYPVLGPADDEIIHSIKEQFCKETNKTLPEGYEIDG